MSEKPCQQSHNESTETFRFDLENDRVYKNEILYGKITEIKGMKVKAKTALLQNVVFTVAGLYNKNSTIDGKHSILNFEFVKE